MKTPEKKTDLKTPPHDRDLLPRIAQHHTIRRMPGRYQQALVIPHRPGLPRGLDGMQIAMPPSPLMAPPPEYSHQTHPPFERAQQPMRPPVHQACTAPHMSVNARLKIISEYRTRKYLMDVTGLCRVCDVVKISTGKPHTCANKHGSPDPEEASEIDCSHGTACNRTRCPFRHGADEPQQ